MENEKRGIGPVTGAAGGGACLSILLTWVFTLMTGVGVPYEVQLALTGGLTLLGGYLVKPGSGKRRS